MDNQLTSYSAYFKLYDPRRDNLQVSFNVTAQPEETVDQFLAKFQELSSMLYDLGLTTDPAGLDEGEKIQEVDGWVLGETASTSQPCIHLYKTPLDFKVTTVYQEKIADLPVTVDVNGKRWDGAPPTREVAEKKGVLSRCSFKVILSDTGKTSDKGNKIYRFDRVYGAPKASANGNGQEDVEIDTYPDVIQVLRGRVLEFTQKARESQAKDKKVASGENLALLVKVLDEAIERGSAEIILSVLSGIEPVELVDELSAKLVRVLLDTVPSHIEDDDGNVVENPSHNEGVLKNLMELWLVAKQYTETA